MPNYYPRVFFFPQFYYMQYQPFKLIIRNLLDRGVDARLIYISTISEQDETYLYNPKLFYKDGIPFLEFKLWRPTLDHFKLLRAAIQFFQFLINRFRLKQFLLQYKPDVIVIGSHLGQMYIRQLQVFCFQMKIPVICLWTIPAILDENQTIPSFISKFLSIKNVMEWDFYNEYMNNHCFLVTGSALRKQLIDNGVKKEQIVLAGNPLHDTIFDTSRHCNMVKSKDMLGNSNIDIKGKYIIFLTEIIQDVFGIDYLRNLIGNLKTVFDNLPKHLKVIIKFHPREDKEIQLLYKTILTGDRYQFTISSKLIPLLKNAEISIGHFTSSMETSLVVGTPCMSINLSGGKSCTFFDKMKYKYLICNNFIALGKNLNSFFENTSFRNKILQTSANWVKENIYLIDGESTNRVADEILKQYNVYKC